MVDLGRGMAGETQSDGIDDEAGSTRNTNAGDAHQVLQVRDIHGNVTLRHDHRPGWLVPATMIVGALVVAAAITFLPSNGKSPDADVTGDTPGDLLVTADLSPNDTGPWGYVSESPDLPGPAITAKLSRPMAAVDEKITRQIRLMGAANFEKQVIRLHLEGPKGRTVSYSA